MGRLDGREGRLDEVHAKAVEHVVERLKEAGVNPKYFDSPGGLAFIQVVVAAAAPIIEEMLVDDLMADLREAGYDGPF